MLKAWTTDTFELDLWRTNDDSTQFLFDVSSGVDEDLLALNLSALANTPKILFRREGEILKTPTPIFIGNTLLAWFVSMGISGNNTQVLINDTKQFIFIIVPTLHKWLENCIRAHFEAHSSSAQGEFASLDASLTLLDKFFKELESAAITHTEATLYPLPSFVDVRYEKNNN